MIAISPRLTLYSLLPLPLVSLSVWFFGDRIHRRFERVQEHFARLSAHVQENLARRARRARVRRRAPRGRRPSSDLNEEYRRPTTCSSSAPRASSTPSLAFFSGLGALLALWIGGREAVAGHITLGQFVAFTVYLGMLNWPMVALGWVINIFQRGLASFRRITDDPRRRARHRQPARRRAPAPAACAASSSSATSRSPTPAPSEPALRGVSFRVPAGSTVALVGRTGSGKSTVLALLPRLFDPPPGTVLLDGVDVRDVRPRVAARAPRGRAAGPVPVLRDGRREHRLRRASRGRRGRDRRARPRRAPRRGRRTASRRASPPRVGERGITLSGGQKQRTAIARALLRDAPVLLLDDCLSSVDTQTEEAILSGLRDEMRRRTTLLVSHRVSTVRDADLILVFEDGADRRARPPRRAARAGRALRGAAPRAAARRGDRGLVSEHDEETGPGLRPPADAAAAPPTCVPTACRWRSPCSSRSPRPPCSSRSRG